MTSRECASPCGRYSVDLVELQTACELNYARLARLLSVMHGHRCRLVLRWKEQMLGALTMEVIGSSRYTTTLQLRQEQTAQWLPVPMLEVRVYHDARMAEVVAAQNSRRLLARYPYPNAQMHQPDEKSQLNLFLGEWLKHCLACGHEIEPVV